MLNTSVPLLPEAHRSTLKEMRGYRILYMNLWVNGKYQGRLCVDELQSEIQPGHFFALEYLGSFIELCINRHNLFQISMGNDARKFFADYLSGKATELQSITDQIQYLNWNRHDRYLCLRLETQQQDDRMHSSIATIGHIEAQSGGTCLYLSAGDCCYCQSFL